MGAWLYSLLSAKMTWSRQNEKKILNGSKTGLRIKQRHREYTFVSM